jgi:hypothetical protein
LLRDVHLICPAWNRRREEKKGPSVSAGSGASVSELQPLTFHCV